MPVFVREPGGFGAVARITQILYGGYGSNHWEVASVEVILLYCALHLRNLIFFVGLISGLFGGPAGDGTTWVTQHVSQRV